MDAIVEYRGGVVPDAVLRHRRRWERSKRPFEPHTDCQAVLNELREELDKAINSFSQMMVTSDQV